MSIYGLRVDSVYGQAHLMIGSVIDGGTPAPVGLHFRGTSTSEYMIPYVYQGTLDGTGSQDLVMTIPGLIQYESQQIYQVTGIARQNGSSDSFVIGSLSSGVTPGTTEAEIYFTSLLVSDDNELTIHLEYMTGVGNFEDGSLVRIVVWYNPTEEAMEW